MFVGAGAVAPSLAQSGRRMNLGERIMSELTYKKFLDRVRTSIDSLSEADLRELILNWAQGTDYSQRSQFLNKLNGSMRKKKPNLDPGHLLCSIEKFAEDVRNGAYCTGWSWDDECREERDGGDESWACEADRFFYSAQNLVHQGAFAAAAQAYQLLFEILEMGEEPGHLPGDPNPYNMLTVNLDEQLALFLRSLYSTWDARERPSLMFEEIQRYWHSISRVGLREIIECVDYPLPGQDVFLTDWINFLSKQNAYPATELMREAVKLQDGVAGLAELARENPAKYPEGYLEWATALETEGKTEESLEVAREALAKIPGDLAIRAKIAELISREGERQNDLQLKLEGYSASFFAAPNVGSLIDLYLTASENDTLPQIQEKVTQAIGELRSQNKTGRQLDSGGKTTHLSNRAYFHTLILSGEYEQLFELCPNHGSLGWSTGDNPKPYLAFLLLSLLSQGGAYGRVLKGQWALVICGRTYLLDQKLRDKYDLVLHKVYGSLKLDDQQQQAYLDWCLKHLAARVEEIVSNRYRTSYSKGAEFVVAIAETLMNLDRKSEAINLINSYHKKYNRFSAFRKELRQAAQGAGIV